MVRMSEPDWSSWVCERVAKCVAAGLLGDVGAANGFSDGSLEDGLVEVVAVAQPGLAIAVRPRGREDPLPGPFTAGVRVLPREGVRQRHVARAAG